LSISNLSDLGLQNKTDTQIAPHERHWKRKESAPRNREIRLKFFKNLMRQIEVLPLYEPAIRLFISLLKNSLRGDFPAYTIHGTPLARYNNLKNAPGFIA
jgi:hypothetical protein